MTTEPKIGIVAIQGDYEAHAKVLERLGVAHTFVRAPGDLAGPHRRNSPRRREHHASEGDDAKRASSTRSSNSQRHGGAFFGTCAGAILLARDVHGPAQDSLGLARHRVSCATATAGSSRAMFTWARRSCARAARDGFHSRADHRIGGKGVEVLAEDAGHPVLVQQGKILAATFHPELTADTAVHEYFVRMARNGVAVAR